MASGITTIGFDADDTLWQNERFFRLTEDRFQALLADHADPDHLAERLLATERRNLKLYGFGAKGFTLSMIEAAVEVTEGRVPASVIGDLIALGRELLEHPMELLPHARATVTALAVDYRLVLITKGDLFDQERKLAQSGLGELFHGVEIVSDKTPETFSRLFRRHGVEPVEAIMAGDSMRSDVLPALAAGAWAAFVPQEGAWGHERAAPPREADRYAQLASLADLPALIDEINQG